MSASVIVSLLTVACSTGGGHQGDEQCPAVGVSCGVPARYDLILTEAESGKTGISDGEGVAFLLDGRRDRLMTSPALAVKTIDDPYKQFPGKHAFALPTYQDGVFDVTANGVGMAPFTFHLVVGERLPFATGNKVTVLHRGDLVIEENQASVGPTDLPSALRGPAFELVQSAVTTGAQGELLSNRPVQPRRAYRAAQLGAQLVNPPTDIVGVGFRVVVADAPTEFRDFVDGEAQVPDSLLVDPGHEFAIVFMGNVRLLSWRVRPADAVVQLPDGDVGPQPPGATLVPFRVIIEGEVCLDVRTTSRAFTLSFQLGVGTCLPV